MASSNAIYDLLGKHARPKSKHSPHENQNHNVGIQRYDPFLATVSHKSGNHNVGTRFKIEYNILFWPHPTLRFRLLSHTCHEKQA